MPASCSSAPGWCSDRGPGLQPAGRGSAPLADPVWCSGTGSAADRGSRAGPRCALDDADRRRSADLPRPDRSRRIPLRHRAPRWHRPRRATRRVRVADPHRKRWRRRGVDEQRCSEPTRAGRDSPHGRWHRSASGDDHRALGLPSLGEAGRRWALHDRGPHERRRPRLRPGRPRRLQAHDDRAHGLRARAVPRGQCWLRCRSPRQQLHHRPSPGRRARERPPRPEGRQGHRRRAGAGEPRRPRADGAALLRRHAAGDLPAVPGRPQCERLQGVQAEVRVVRRRVGGVGHSPGTPTSAR